MSNNNKNKSDFYSRHKQHQADKDSSAKIASAVIIAMFILAAQVGGEFIAGLFVIVAIVAIIWFLVSCASSADKNEIPKAYRNSSNIAECSKKRMQVQAKHDFPKPGENKQCDDEIRKINQEYWGHDCCR
ncbi:MAG: hypothetical protein FWG70_09820 [Oscillospiraceae bacterium]|nr:hypothetical protein [Oscillospiraceae bacterium]